MLPDGTKVSKGQVVVWSPYSMGRDPSLWDDPNTFKPERWIPKDSNRDPSARKTSLYGPTEIGVSDFKYPVFNSGYRVCIGRPRT